MFKKIKLISRTNLLLFLSMSALLMSTEVIAHSKAHIKKDPTKNDFNLNEKEVSRPTLSASPISNKVVNKDVVTQPVVVEVKEKYKLVSISLIGNNKRALINNDWLTLGQSMRGIKVVSIEQDQVVIEKNNKTMVLTLDKNSSVFKIDRNFKESTIQAVGDDNE